MGLKDTMEKTKYSFAEKGKSAVLNYAPFSNQDIQINPKFESFLPPLREDERLLLKLQIIQHGVLDPIKVWRKPGTNIYYILDGHNRWSIVNEIGLDKSDLKLHVFDFETEDEALTWMAMNQKGRRESTETAKSYLVGKIYQDSKKNSWDRTRANLEGEGKRTRDILIQKLDVSEHAIRMANELATVFDSVGENLRTQLLSESVKVKLGTISLAYQYIDKLQESQVDDFKAYTDFINSLTKKKEKVKPVVKTQMIILKEVKSLLKTNSTESFNTSRAKLLALIEDYGSRFISK